jgi:hypothetical protein
MQPNIDHLELPMDSGEDLQTGAKLAQAGELLGRALHLGQMRSAQTMAGDGTVVIVLAQGKGYCTTVVEPDGSSTAELTTLALPPAGP